MLSIPGDLLAGIDLTIWATSSQSTCIKLNWSDTGKILGSKTDAKRSKLHSLARESILSTATCPTDEKNRLKSFAPVLSSLLNDLILADFLGINDRIVFHNNLSNNLLPLCNHETLVYDLRNVPRTFAQIIEVRISKKAECAKRSNCMVQCKLCW